MKSYEAAVASLQRLDERLLREDDSLKRGVAARIDYQEAQSLVGLTGGFLHYNDLVLFDLNTNVLVPTEEMVRARGLLVKRRSLQKTTSSAMLDARVLTEVTGLDEAHFRLNEIEAFAGDHKTPDDFEDAVAGLDALLGRSAISASNSMAAVLAVAHDQPPLLGAMLIFDHWRVHESGKVTEIAPFLFALFLCNRKFTRSHFPALACGLWRQSPKWDAGHSHEERFLLLASAIHDAAQRTMSEMDRLVLARVSLRLKCSDKSEPENSLLRLIELFVTYPLVTVDFAARRLRLSPQAIEYQMKRLGSALPREKTGRKRYRAWGI